MTGAVLRSDLWGGGAEIEFGEAEAPPKMA